MFHTVNPHNSKSPRHDANRKNAISTYENKAVNKRGLTLRDAREGWWLGGSERKSGEVWYLPWLLDQRSRERV